MSGWDVSRLSYVYGVKLIDGTELVAKFPQRPGTYQDASNALPGLVGEPGQPLGTHHLINTKDGAVCIPADKILYHFVRLK